jgi:hypothetical protein
VQVYLLWYNTMHFDNINGFNNNINKI